MISYCNLLNVSKPLVEGVAETHQPYLYLTERHLQAMWLEQKYFRQLTTLEDLPITVLSPGIWNSEAGPDFLKAHILVGNQELHGDIELHLSEESWYHHHHHTDPRYNNVILHVSFWGREDLHSIATSDGGDIHRALLQPKLTIPESRLMKLIDLDLYPYQRFAGSGRCARELFNTLSETKTIALFESAAGWRLEQKHNLLREKIPSQMGIAGGIAMVLGYKHNPEAFFEIFTHLCQHRSLDEKTLFAYALGMGGFFAEPHRKRWSGSSYYTLLAGLFEKLPFKDIPSIPLRLDKIRPANHPVRRLAVLAKICLDTSFEGHADAMAACWEDHWRGATLRTWRALRRALLDLIPSYYDEYWSVHYTFETKPQAKAIAWIGEDVKNEMLLNVYMPMLYGQIRTRGQRDEWEAFQRFFASLPASQSKKTQYLTHRFFGNTSMQNLLSRADLQQGAYQIHRDFCIHFEASCIGCPFVERYQQRKDIELK